MLQAVTLIKFHIALVSFLLGAALTQWFKNMDGNAVFLLIVAGALMLPLAILSMPTSEEPAAQDTPEAEAARLERLKEEMKKDPQKAARIRCMDGRRLG